MKSSRHEFSSASVAALIPVVIAGLIAIAAGAWAHGMFTHRWGGGADFSDAVAVLERFPQSFGAWRMQTEEPMDESVLETLQCANHVHRTYRNVETSELVSVAVIVGPAGPTAVHTPEICYSSRAYTIDQGRKKETFNSGEVSHAFWKTKFKSRQPGGGTLIVYYAWSADQAWKASKTPRYEFGGSPYLYKIQVAGAPLLGDKGGYDDLCGRFLSDLLDSDWTSSHRI